jgi:ribosomal protein S18 acetylase RimI-like enzyme
VTEGLPGRNRTGTYSRLAAGELRGEPFGQNCSNRTGWARYKTWPSRAEHNSMGDSPLVLRHATEHDHKVIIQLIDRAAEWLRTKNTDQWAQPWPSVEDRSHRILRDLRLAKTWIAWDGGTPAATITADSADRPIWPAEMLRDRAVYVCRLVVSRSHAGQGLGAALLDWAGLRAMRRHGARWVRVDVWTTNKALHAYYRRQGFESCGLSAAIDHYPSAALFQKATDRIKPTGRTLFRLVPPLGS